MDLLTAILDLTIVFQGALLFILPELSRPGIFFGVSIVPGSACLPAARRIVRVFRRATGAGALLAIAVVHLSSHPLPDWRVVLAVSLQILVSFVALAAARGKAQELAVVQPSPQPLPAVVRPFDVPGGWLFFLGPMLVLAVAAWFLHANWDSIPERFPVHWGIRGQVDRWADRSPGSVYTLLAVGLFTNALLMWIAYYIFCRTRQVESVGAPAGREARFRRFNYILLLVIAYATSMLHATLATRVLWAARLEELERATWVILFLPLLVAIPAVIYSLRLGQGGSRLDGGGTTAMAGDGTPDDCWIAGGIYYNPRDRALFVEKRIGFGWTLNFGNRWSWVFMLVVVAGPLIIIGLARFMR